MFKHFRRRWSDTGKILRELYSTIGWYRAILVFPAVIFFTLVVVLMMQLEDYDEIDRWEKYMEDLIKRDRVS